MMFFYPMLASTTVSKNITLAICKTLERYLLLYETDNILNDINRHLPRGSKIIKQRRGLYLKESVDVTQEAPTKPEDSPERMRARGQYKKDEKDKRQRKEDLEKRQRELSKSKVEMPYKDTFSVEPTYMQIDSELTGRQVIGIKVIPYPVKSEGDLVELLLNDRYAPLLVKWLRMFYRAVIRLGWGAIRAGHIPFLAKRPVTGKAIPDIIHAGTKHTKHIFALVNQSEIETSDFLSEPKNVHRLFKQGWSSLIIADDVNQRVSFCMKGFIQSGFCTEVNYSYLLSSFGHEKLQIYNDLEDLQKKSSPFFRLKKPIKKIFEGHSMKLDKKQIINERQVLIEDVKTFSKKADKIFASIQQSIKKNDISSIKKIASNIPKIPISTIEKISKKLSPNFENSYKMSERVLKNSTNISGDKLKAFSIIVGLKSSYKISDYKKETKNNLLKITEKIRKTKKGEEIMALGGLSTEVVSRSVAVVFSLLVIFLVAPLLI